MLGLALQGERERVTPPGIEVRASGEEELGAWVDVLVEGDLHPDTQGVPQHEEFPREVLATAERDLGAAQGVRRYVALLSARLADAAAAGCDVAVITTAPGSKSQQNAQRQGFDLLYTRAILVKQA